MGRVQERPMRKNPKGENDFLPVRFMDAGIRSMEGEGNEQPCTYTGDVSK